MRTRIDENAVTIWLSAQETGDWARRPGAAWPYSHLADRRLMASYDTNGLCDLTVNGIGFAGTFLDRHYYSIDTPRDLSAAELNACVADHLRDVLPAEHPCYHVAVGQFEETNCC